MLKRYAPRPRARPRVLVIGRRDQQSNHEPVAGVRSSPDGRRLRERGWRRSESVADEPVRVLLIGSDDDVAVSGDVRALAELLPETRVVVASRAKDQDDRGVRTVGRRKHLGPVALAKLMWAIRYEARSAEIVDVRAPRLVIAALMAATLRRKRVVMHFIDSSPLDDQPQSAAARLRSRACRLLDGLIYRRASLIVTDGGRGQRELVERYRVSPWRVRIRVDHGLDAPSDDSSRAAARSRLDLPPDAFVVCHVDAPVARADAELLLSAWRELIGGWEWTLVPPCAYCSPPTATLAEVWGRQVSRPTWPTP